MQDITTYSDQELSMIVYNTEPLYRMRHNVHTLTAELKGLFTFTDEQYAELLNDLESEDDE